MSLNLEEKKAAVAEISAQVAGAQAIVLAEYRGLEVGEMTELRKKARASGVYLRVLKNTLARRAVAESPFKGLSDQMVGPLAYGISAGHRGFSSAVTSVGWQSATSSHSTSARRALPAWSAASAAATTPTT